MKTGSFLGMKSIFLLAALALSGCSPNFTLSISDPGNAVVARAGSGPGNGGGFEGKISPYQYFDSSHPCAQTDAKGAPLPNSELHIRETSALRSARLVRDACNLLDLPRDIPMSDILPAQNGSGGVIYNSLPYAPASPILSPPQANLFQSSEKLEDLYWDHVNVWAYPDSGNAPDGSATADLLRENTSNSAHALAHWMQGPTNSKFTCSVFVKAAGRTRGVLQLFEDSTGNMVDTVFDLSAGTASGRASGLATLSDAQIRPQGGGWYRVVVSGTLRPTASSSFPVCSLYMRDPSNNSPYTGDGTSGMLAWGFQSETSETLTPYYSVTTMLAFGLP